MARLYARGHGSRGARNPGRKRVRVVGGGRGRVLRVDGSFASWYRPGEAATGSVWDALVAPLLALPEARRRRVLILGLGGGSAARLVRALAPTARIVGVERSSDVLEAARQHFDLDDLGVEVVHADAYAYLRRSRGRFDCVIEDVFVGSARRLRKPSWLPEPGLPLAARRLAPGGLLVSNTLDEHREVRESLRDSFPGLLCIRVREYDNRVLVGGPESLDASRLRGALAREPILRPALARFSVRRLAR